MGNPGALTGCRILRVVNYSLQIGIINLKFDELGSKKKTGGAYV